MFLPNPTAEDQIMGFDLKDQSDQTTSNIYKERDVV
jgi:hypothetical protein